MLLSRALRRLLLQATEAHEGRLLRPESFETFKSLTLSRGVPGVGCLNGRLLLQAAEAHEGHLGSKGHRGHLLGLETLRPLAAAAGGGMASVSSPAEAATGRSDGEGGGKGMGIITGAATTTTGMAATTARALGLGSVVQPRKNASSQAYDQSKDIQSSHLIHKLELQLKSLSSDLSGLRFGAQFSQHMLQIHWTRGHGWGAPLICPLEPIPMHPAAQVLHYGMSCFEGMKAYKGGDGTVRLFRPDKNMNRFALSCQRLNLPSFDKGELLECIKELLRVESHWVPQKDGFSLYLRPMMMATTPFLGVGPPSDALFCCTLSPAGPYFPDGLKPISLYVDSANARAYPGGVGDRKVAGNYAPTILPQVEAAKKGCAQVLYVLRDFKQAAPKEAAEQEGEEGEEGEEEDGWVGESGAMNIFFLLRKSGVPGASGGVPGVGGAAGASEAQGNGHKASANGGANVGADYANGAHGANGAANGGATYGATGADFANGTNGAHVANGVHGTNGTSGATNGAAHAANDAVTDAGANDGGASDVGSSGVMSWSSSAADGAPEYELVTPPLDGLILPGVTRDSVLELVRNWGDNIQVSERPMRLSELKRAHKEGRLVEAFGTGTAVIIQPISSFLLPSGAQLSIPVDELACSYWTECGPGQAHLQPVLGAPFSLAGRLYRAMLDIQYGHVEHPWSVCV